MANEIFKLESPCVYGPLNPGLFSNSLAQSLHLHTKLLSLFSESANFKIVSPKHHYFPSFSTLCCNLCSTLHILGKILAPELTNSQIYGLNLHFIIFEI